MEWNSLEEGGIAQFRFLSLSLHTAFLDGFLPNEQELET